jgi:hypothetical protein
MTDAFSFPVGPIVPLVTPFDDAEGIDEDALRRLVEHMLASGVAGILAGQVLEGDVEVEVTARLPALEARVLDGEARFAVPASELHVFAPEGDALWHGAGTRDVVAA